MVKNGGFEQHKQREYFSSTCDTKVLDLKDWYAANCHAIVCDSTYHPQNQREKSYETCRHGGFAPYQNNTAIEMMFSYRCSNSEKTSQGFASYLSTDLGTNLEVGKIYEVGFWIYVVKNEYTDSLAASHIGFKLSKSFSLKTDGNSMAWFGTAYNDATPVYNQWTYIRKLVRPLCGVRYLHFGIFKEFNWTLKGNDEFIKNKGGWKIKEKEYFDDHLYYYIDAVSVQDVTATTVVNKATVTDIYAKCVEPEPPNSKEIPIFPTQAAYFSTKSSLLDVNAQKTLDSVAVIIKRTPRAVFEVIGHTDNIGDKHEQLSLDRAKAAAHYLTTKHNVANFRFTTRGLGTSDAKGNNATETGRAMNRRVEITQATLDFDNFAYRAAIKYSQNKNMDSAFILLNIWQRVINPPSYLIVAYFDPRLQALQIDKPRWNLFYKNVKQSYQKRFGSNALLAFRLDSLYCEDQRYRTLEEGIQNIEGIDNGDTKFTFPMIEAKKWQSEDSCHFVCLTQIIKKYGFPKISEVGKRQASTAFFIIQHQKEVAVLEFYLPIIKKTCEEGEADWGNYAMLFDRIEVYNKRPQRYGTQFKALGNNTYALFPLQNINLVNEYRAQLDLRPIPDETLTRILTNY